MPTRHRGSSPTETEATTTAPTKTKDDDDDDDDDGDTTTASTHPPTKVVKGRLNTRAINWEKPIIHLTLNILFLPPLRCCCAAPCSEFHK